MRYDTRFLLKKTACWQNKFPGKKVIPYFCSCNKKNYYCPLNFDVFAHVCA